MGEIFFLILKVRHVTELQTAKRSLCNSKSLSQYKASRLWWLTWFAFKWSQDKDLPLPIHRNMSVKAISILCSRTSEPPIKIKYRFKFIYVYVYI